MQDAWEQAQRALLCLQVDPVGLGGVWLHAGYGPARQAWLKQLQDVGLNLQRMPHHIDHERLLGGIDLSLTLSQGRVVTHAGLLAQAHQGVVLLPMADKLPSHTLAMLLQAQDQGVVHGAGIQASHPSQFAVVALDESLEDEPGVPAKLKERLAKLGVDPANSPRLTTASATASLVEKLHVSEASQVVSALASAAVATTEAAMGECLSKASPTK
jgi:magnesium chelatase subunit D